MIQDDRNPEKNRCKVSAIRMEYIVAPLVILGLLFLVYFFFDLYPFGDKSVAWCDMRQQVIPLLIQFRDILLGDADMFLNMENAGGMNFWGVFFFFLSSPFTFLTAVVDKEKMYVFVNLMVAWKMMLAGLTASICLSRLLRGLSRGQNIALSVMYGCCGYALLYYQNMIWLDVLYLFPLMILALVHLVMKGRSGWYTVMLTAFMFVNYYITYMLVIFIILSFGTYIFAFFPGDRGMKRQRILALAVGSIWALFLSAAVWLPAIFQFTVSARGGNLVDSLQSGGLLTHIETKMAVLLGTAFLIVPVLYLLKKEYRRDNTYRYLCVLLFLLFLPVFLNPINKMWHTGSYQAFPLRFGFILIFLGLLLGGILIQSINLDQPAAKSKGWAILILMGMLALYGSVIYTLLSHDFDTLSRYTKKLWVPEDTYKLLLFLFASAAGVYFLSTFFYKERWVTKRIFTWILLLTACLESGIGISAYMGSAANDEQSYAVRLDLADRIDEDSFYRVKYQEKYFDANLLGGLGYNTLNHYTSLTSERYMSLVKLLGYSSYWMEVTSNGGTALTDALWTNRYVIAKDTAVDPDWCTVYSNANYIIYENPNVFPLGIVSSSNLGEVSELPGKDRAVNQQFLADVLFGEDSLALRRYEWTSIHNLRYECGENRHSLQRINQALESTIRYTIQVGAKETLYFDCFDNVSTALKEQVYSSVSVYVNGEKMIDAYPKQSANGILELGTFEQETVTVELEILKDVSAESFGIFGIETSSLEALIPSANTAKLEVEGNRITGTARGTSEGDFLFLAIPYEKGFSAAVNGVKVEAVDTLGGFLAIPLQEGENHISVVYWPRGIRAGLILSAVSLIAFAGVALKKRWRSHVPEGHGRSLGMKETAPARHELAERFMGAAFILIFIGVAAIIYVMPMVIFLL